MAEDILGSSTTRRGRPGARGREQKPTAKETVRGVRRSDPNPFHQGSPEGIAYAFTEQLQRHAGGRGPFAHVAKRALDSHDPQPADDMPPVPKEKPATFWPVLPVSARFASMIAAAEGTIDDYGEVRRNAEGRWVSLGRYQLQRGGLRDLGILQGGEWDQVRLNLSNEDDFRFKPALQDIAFAGYLADKELYARNSGLLDDLGQTITGVKATFPITEAGILAATHREGETAVQMYLDYQRAHAWTTDPETFPVGTIPGSGRDIRAAFLAIETRLRTFSDVPLRASRIDAPLLTPATFERFEEGL